MFTREQVEQAIRVQHTAYELIRWLRIGGTLESLSFAERHEAINEVQAADAWLRANRERIPPHLLPDEADRAAFVNMLASFQETSMSRRWRLPKEGCRCRWCGDIVWRGGWPTRLGQRERRSAHWMKLHALRDLANDLGLPLLLSDLEPLADRRGALGNAIAWVAYANELVHRCNYVGNRPRYSRTGHGLVVLWRQIAYRHGRVAEDFALRWERIEHGRQRVAKALNALVKRLITG